MKKHILILALVSIAFGGFSQVPQELDTDIMK